MPAPKGGKKAAAKPRRGAATLSAELAAASWAEADRALAEAMAEFENLQACATQKERREAMELLAQALRRAGRRRGLDWQIGAGVFRGDERLARGQVAAAPKRQPK